MTESRDDAVRLLDVCRRIEFAMAGLYRYLADRYPDLPDVAAALRKTANEEENHALQFQLASKLPNLLVELKVGVEAADRLLKTVQDLDAKIRQAPPSAVTALQVALELERRLTDYHMDSIGVFQSPQLQEMFKAMMAADKNHQGALGEALAKLSPESGPRPGSKE